jgi:hypothetical protein
MDRDLWIRSLIRHFANVGQRPETETRLLEAIAPKLADLADDCFDEASLRATIGAVRSVQSPFRIRDALQAHMATRKPAWDIGEGEDDPDLTQEDRIILAVWNKHRANGFPSARGRDLIDRMTIALDVQRLNCPRVFRYICQHDLDASAIAVRRGWQAEKRGLDVEWDDAAGIMRKVHANREDRRALRLLARIVGRWAPQHLGLLPPDIIEEVARDPEMMLPVFVELRARLGDPRPVGREEQLNALAERRKPTPNYLDPAYLDQVNPLPNGRKRTDATTATTPTAQHPASSERLADC